MNHIAIFREGDKDEYELGNGTKLKLGDIKPAFARKDKVSFVGLYTIKADGENIKNNITVYSLPKYFPKDKCKLDNLPEIQEQIKTICKVIEKLRKNGKIFDDEEYLFDLYQLKVSKQTVNRYELAEFIIEDYLQDGLYVKNLTEFRKGGIGRTSWGKTVSKVQPFIQSGSPIYLELVNKHQIIDENDFISILNANVVNQCLDFIGPLISSGIEYIETEPLGKDLSAYSSVINSRSTYVFKEREINLFKALEAWCSSTRYYENYAGVTCFDRVWEWVNDAVWGNIENPESGEPSYFIGNETYFGVGEAIPDTINIQGSGTDDNKAGTNDSEVYIFDSKYYTADYVGPKDGNKVIGFPANSDIVKQVAYLKLIKSQFKAKAFYNSFLLPEYSGTCTDVVKDQFKVADDKWFSVIGYVEPGKFRLERLTEAENINEDENLVGVVLVNPDKIYDKFLNGETVKPEELQVTGKYLELKAKRQSAE